MSEALYLNDPEGNGLEIYRDRDPETWVWNDGNVNMDTHEVDAEALVKHASTEGWNGMPEGAKIGHLHLKTSNINESKDFYIDTLGLKIVVGNFLMHYSCQRKITITILQLILGNLIKNAKI